MPDLEIMDPEAALGHLVRGALVARLGAEFATADPLIRPSGFADYQSNVAMSLAKRLGRSPREVAQDIAAELAGSPLLERAEVSGPGFINLTLRDSWIAAQANEQLADTRLGVPRADPAQRIVVDYSGPNVAKELHAGHLRATVEGDAIVRVLEYLGHEVTRAAHLGDWGTQFGMLIEHALDVGEQATYDQLVAGEFTAFYQAARAKFDGDQGFADRSRRRVVELQAGEEQAVRLWQLLVDDSMAYLRRLYDRLGVTLTDADMAPESFYNPMLADVCAELEDRGLAVISDGALCAYPPGFTGRDGNPLPLMLRKSDGGYGYDTTDVAAIRYRLRDLGATRLIYVVGSEQHQHLEMVFGLARQAGWLTGGATAEHAVVGLMTGPGGQRLRTRTGEQVKLVSLIEEAVERAEKVIAERYDDPQQRAQIAEAVGIGALKYGDLSVARDSSYALDFDRLLALTGNTGPYLQYAAARIRSIFQRAGLDPAAAAGPILPGTAAERALALQLLGLGRAVADVSAGAEPHKLAGFVFDVASAFTTFYEQCPVLSAADDVRASRLALCALSLRVLETGLGLLGIPVPDRM
ncbi:MAG TPA: arginine--tRNA ligase [Streptosporangiaceae bacterium]|nr:arginine--tRNA ligase [Streptosporangiaceae bacterium]